MVERRWPVADAALVGVEEEQDLDEEVRLACQELHYELESSESFESFFDSVEADSRLSTYRFDITWVTRSEWHGFQKRLLRALSPEDGGVWYSTWKVRDSGFHVQFRPPEDDPTWTPSRYRPRVRIPRGRVLHEESKNAIGLPVHRFTITYADARHLFESGGGSMIFGSVV